MKRTVCVLGMILLLGSSCRSRGIPLHDLRGKQWVWPYFTYDQPTVVAFWNTREVRCLDAFPALNTLSHREGSVQLVTVCASADQAKIRKWMRYERCEFDVLLDPDEKLARRLKVNHYPTFIMFDMKGKELRRYLDVTTIHNWFDRSRWLEKATAE